MNRHFDFHFKTEIVTIHPGEFYVSNSQEVIATVLGSCIAVCIYDLKNGVGGMNHFMLPETKSDKIILSGNITSLKPEELVSKPLKYGVHAMEMLISELQKKGAERKYFRAKIFGGGNMLQTKSASLAIGKKNIIFTRSFLNTEKIPLDNESVGESFSRKIYFLTGSSSIFVKRMPIYVAKTEEISYSKKLINNKIKPDITLY